MRRHRVMDLFWSNITEEQGDWHNVKDLTPSPKSIGCKIRVKLSNDDETYAYFYEDFPGWAPKFAGQSCRFWHSKTHDPLYNVIAWKKLKEPE